MCDCTSCSYTDRLSGWPDLLGEETPMHAEKKGGFANWPRGEPKGSVASAQEYRKHALHCGSIGLPKPWRFVPGQPPKFSTYGLVMPVTPAPKSFMEWNARTGKLLGEKARQAEAQRASPETPAKAPQHFPELDRQPEAARIYAMPKSKPKRPRGRPAMEGRMVVVKLDEAMIQRALRLGSGKITAGIRKALASKG